MKKHIFNSDGDINIGKGAYGVVLSNSKDPTTKNATVLISLKHLTVKTIADIIVVLQFLLTATSLVKRV
jgi:hypothetical protein